MIKNKSYLICDAKNYDEDTLYITINQDQLKTLTINQYYQVQIFLVNGDFSGDFNANNISLGSQVTLIKKIEIGTPGLKGLVNGSVYPTIGEIEGYLTYTTQSPLNEIIDTYQIIIVDNDTNEIYNSGIVKNNLKYEFKHKIIASELAQGQYRLTVKLMTPTGYVYSLNEVSFTIAYEEDNENSLQVIFEDNDLYPNLSIKKECDECYIQKLNMDKTWQMLNNKTTAVDLAFEFQTLSIYRCFYKNENKWYKTQDLQYIKHSDTIDLIDSKGKYLKLAYNIKVTNYKYVTQNSITATLGSKYPIIRNNAHTGYFQFSLSGLLSGEGTIDSMLSQVSIDSCEHVVKLGGDEKHTNILDGHQNILSAIRSKAQMDLCYKRGAYEKLFRDSVISFLTDGKIKYFRSETEGNKIVVLTDISFTPEEQLGRDIYSFSATVTEVADANSENLQKYGFGGATL